MKPETINAIEVMAKSDPEVTPEIVREIMRVCKSARLGRRQMIPAKEAMAILGISRPTLRVLSKSGKLHEVRITPRKMRFYLDEVEDLATTPVVA